jgi:hypothetical protein
MQCTLCNAFERQFSNQTIKIHFLPPPFHRNTTPITTIPKALVFAAYEYEQGFGYIKGYNLNAYDKTFNVIII